MFKKWFIGLLVVLVLLLMLFGNGYQKDVKKKHNMEVALRNKYIGKTFPMDGIIGLDSLPVDPDIFRHKKHTVVDLWFIGCSSCIKEMKNFPDHLRNNPQLQFMSVSIDPWREWKQLLEGDRNQLGKTYTDEKYENELYQGKNNFSGLAFLSERHEGWHHVDRQNTEDALRDAQGLDIHYYPTYFLVNSEGIIIDRFDKFQEYHYSSLMKTIRDKAGFLYFIITEEGVLTVISYIVLAYFIVSLLFFGVRWLILNRREMA